MGARLIAASEVAFKGMRRPDIRVTQEMVVEVRRALKQSGGTLVVPLKEAVSIFGLHPAYADPDRATLLASSLSRKLGVRVGTRERGKYLTFRLKD
jgi:hypothetical protein